MRVKWLMVGAALAVAGSARAADGLQLQPPGALEGAASHAEGVLAPSPLRLDASDLADASDIGARPILTDALYGAVIGLLIGTGVALLEGGNWGRDLAIGAGAGLIVGAAYGALADTGPASIVGDGLGSRPQPGPRAAGLGFAGHF